MRILLRLERVPAAWASRRVWVHPGPWALFAALLAVAGCRPPVRDAWQGYVEAEFVRVAAPLGGRLEVLAVQRGEQVHSNQLLFVLEGQVEEAARREAEDRLRQARARLENLTKGRRPSEIEALEARLAQASSSLQLAEAERSRADRLQADGAISRAEFDQAETVFERDRRRVQELEAELATARLGGREDEIRAAEAEVAAMAAALERAVWSVGQKRQAAGEAALVHDTLYREGEWVAPGSPVVSLLPPGHLKVRFFVPQAEANGLRLGQVVPVRLDGGAPPRPARLVYVSPQVEYTPPVIYSQENRAKLVRMFEAAFEAPDVTALHPGQPVDVLKP